MDSKRRKEPNKSSHGGKKTSKKRKRSDDQRELVEGEPALKKRKVDDSSTSNGGSDRTKSTASEIREKVLEFLTKNRGTKYPLREILDNVKSELIGVTLPKITYACRFMYDRGGISLSRKQGFHIYFVSVDGMNGFVGYDGDYEFVEDSNDDDEEEEEEEEEDHEKPANLEDTLRRILLDNKGQRFSVSDLNDNFEVSKCFKKKTYTNSRLSRIGKTLKKMWEKSKVIHRELNDGAFEYFIPLERIRRRNAAPIIVDLTVKEEEEEVNIVPPPLPILQPPPPPPQPQVSQQNEKREFKNGIFVECKIMNSVFSKTCKFVSEVPQKGANSFKKCTFSNIAFKDCVFCNCEVTNCQFQF